MKLIWKLLRQHLSIGQLVGFFFANLLGMLIVLLSFQFYQDVKPAFEQEDGFIKSDYLIVSKEITTIGGLNGAQSFSEDEIDEIRQQPFCKNVGGFTSTQFKVNAELAIAGIPALNTEIFFESVPDEFVDIDKSRWHYKEGDEVVPIVLPRSYLALYNFGFAKSQAMPQVSEELAKKVEMTLVLRGNGNSGVYAEMLQGKVVGFSNRLNTILAPEAFIKWSNDRYAPESDEAPTRLIVKVKNPADEEIMKYFEAQGYDVADDKLETGKTMYFLLIIISIVIAIGLLISALSFYILMLSIFLLVQKNSVKMQNLLLIGYSPTQVALPYQLLTIGINALVLVISYIGVAILRNVYMTMLWDIFPDLEKKSLLPVVLIGLLLFMLVSIANIVAIRKKIMKIWHNRI